MSLIPTIRKLWPGNAKPDGKQCGTSTLKRIRPLLRRIIGNEPPAPPPRPAADPVVPQTLDEAEAALKVLQAAAKIVRDKMAQNPQLPRGEECFSDTGPKPSATAGRKTFRPRYARQPAGEPLSILALRRSLARPLCPASPTPTARNPAPCEMQARSLPTSKSSSCWTHTTRPCPTFASWTSLSSRRCSKPATFGTRHVVAASKIRRPPHTPPHPQLRTHRRPGYFADSAVAERPDPGRTVVDSPDGRGEPLAAPSLFLQPRKRTMRTSILRAFIPTAKVPKFENADGEHHPACRRR